MMIYWELYWAFFQIGLFSFGGGYAVMPMIQRYIVEQKGWLTFLELIDITAISQTIPGSIAVNTATFVGTFIAGYPGALIATIASVTPSFILLIILAYYYSKNSNLFFIQDILAGLRPAVVSLIAIAAVTLTISSLIINTNVSWLSVENIQWPAVVSAIGSIILLVRFKTDTILVIFFGATIGILFHFIF